MADPTIDWTNRRVEDCKSRKGRGVVPNGLLDGSAAAVRFID